MRPISARGPGSRLFYQAPEVCIVSAAARVAAALGERAEEVCRRYLPQGRKQGRYWTAGDVYGARGAVALRPPGAPRRPRKVDRRKQR